MAIPATGSSTSKDVPLVDKESTGFNSLNSETFLKLLVTQLQNQDPTNPTSNEDLLNQLSAMRNLQANLELSDTLKSITLNQQLSSGASLIGKEVTALDDKNAELTGIVDKVLVKDGKTYLNIGDQQVLMSNVQSVTLDPDH